MKKVIVLAALCLGTAACSPYAAKGPFGGVSASQITSDTYRISANGNSFTSSERVEDFVLMKAAETAKASGHTHFAIVTDRDTSRTVRYQDGPGVVRVYGNTALYSSPSYSTSRKAGRETMVQVFTVPAGQTAPPGSFAADEIIQNVGPRLKAVF